MIIVGTYHVEVVEPQTRLVDFCIGLFPQLPTKNAVKKAIKRKEIEHNGAVGYAGNWINSGDTIQLVDHETNIPKPFPLAIEIIHEEDAFAVVFKPSGLRINGNQYRTLENALVDQLTPSNAEDAFKWGRPVHRLDSATSGLVIIAKTHAAHRIFGEQFTSRGIKKQYHAVVQGTPENQRIAIDIDGKSAETELTVISTVPSLRNESISLLMLQPKTGRTHQLRKHCLAIGHPIVGDQLYGQEGNVMKHKGLFLAATALEFHHPLTNEKCAISATIPPKFEALLAREQRRVEAFQETQRISSQRQV
jgi:23S rRNA pseudouridine1911/1915/1917 synthase